MKSKILLPTDSVRRFGLLLCLSACVPLSLAAGAGGATGQAPGFSFDCENTPENPCRKLVARDRKDKPIRIESSSAAWSERYRKVIVVTDNVNELIAQGAAHYAITWFGLEDSGEEIIAHPLLTPDQAKAFRLFDLEGVTLDGERLYAIGSLALHGKDPERDRWERHQFVQMDLVKAADGLGAADLAHVASRWPNFRDWVLSKSGQEWSGEQTRGRAEGAGINVEALSVTDTGNLIIGFRGPLSADGGALALEIALPPTMDQDPVLVQRHVIPPLDVPHIPKGAAKTLRAISPVVGKPGEYYVLLGPLGYEKEAIVLAHWDANTGRLSRATALPRGFVGEGVSAIPGNRVLVVDDLDERILIATEH